MHEVPRQSTRGPSAHTITAATLLVVGLVYGYLSLNEGIGSVGETGAGFFPLLVAIVLVISAGTVLVEERRSAVEPDSDVRSVERTDVAPADDVDGAHWLRLIGVLAASMAVPLLATTTGFVVTLSFAVVVIAKIMGMPGTLKPIALGVGFGAAAWLIFVYWLFVPLPAGVLGLA